MSEEINFSKVDVSLDVSILDDAADKVKGDRNHAYGHPYTNHNNTARLYNAYLFAKYGTLFTLDAEDVCMLNILQKVSREAHRGTRDGLVDIAGYAANIAIVRDAEVAPTMVSTERPVPTPRKRQR